MSRRRTASALRREAPHYAGFEPAVGSGTGFAGRPKVNKQETQLFRSPPQRHLKLSLSSLCHNLKLIRSERRHHPVTRLTFAGRTSAVQNTAPGSRDHSCRSKRSQGLLSSSADAPDPPPPLIISARGLALSDDFRTTKLQQHPFNESLNF